MIDLEEAIKIFNNQSLAFGEVTNKLSNRRDLHAFILLDRLLPDDVVIIGGVAHDMIYVHVELDMLCKVATADNIRELARCGLIYSESEDALYMFT